jgi:hypothetical protein
MPVFKILTRVFSDVQNTIIVNWYTPEWEDCNRSSVVMDADMWF